MGLRTLVSVGTAVLSVAAVGCATPNLVVYSAVNGPPHPFRRRPASSVEVLIGNPTSRPHVDVGLFEISQGITNDAKRRSTEDMIGSLRVHAGLRGCDAVQVLNVELPGRSEWQVVRGVCEMYTDAPLVSAAAPAPAPVFPSEGQACVPNDNLSPICIDPMVCDNGHCASPYH